MDFPDVRKHCLAAVTILSVTFAGKQSLRRAKMTCSHSLLIARKTNIFSAAVPRFSLMYHEPYVLLNHFKMNAQKMNYIHSLCTSQLSEFLITQHSDDAEPHTNDA